ncbi:MAG: flagellar hook assembly protein FlgD [Deltaproteobacteria bacterium]|nr:flagellar hook assembly protein FlgD [Deltaproteobacteria bacterium]
MSTAETSAALRAAGNSLQNSYAKKSQSGDTMGKDDFMKLMMAQATHQDPLNPMDSQGMMQQLTAMGSMEQLINVNKNLDQLGKVQSDISRASTFALLEKDVTIPGGKVRLSDGLAAGMQFGLPREATASEVVISSAEGQIVRNLDLGAQSAGNHTVQWDGRNNQGELVPDGSYTYTVNASAQDSETIPAELYVSGKVSGIRFDKGRLLLKVNGEDVDLRDVVELKNDSQRLFGDRKPQPLRQILTPRPPTQQFRP